MRPKNYDELSEHVFDQVENNLNNITEILVGDTYSPVSEIIDIDLKKLLHKYILVKLGELGSINNREYNVEGYSNGLAIDLDEIKIRFENKRMMVYTTRGDIGETE